MNKDFDAYFKQVTDEENRLETARQEGKIEERKAITRKLLKSGSTLEQIEKILGFDPKKYLWATINDFSKRTLTATLKF